MFNKNKWFFSEMRIDGLALKESIFFPTKPLERRDLLNFIKVWFISSRLLSFRNKSSINVFLGLLSEDTLICSNLIMWSHMLQTHVQLAMEAGPFLAKGQIPSEWVLCFISFAYLHSFHKPVGNRLGPLEGKNKSSRTSGYLLIILAFQLIMRCSLRQSWLNRPWVEQV